MVLMGIAHDLFSFFFFPPNHSQARHRRGRRRLSKRKHKRGGRIITGIISNLSLGTLPVPVVVEVDIVKVSFQRLLPQ